MTEHTLVYNDFINNHEVNHGKYWLQHNVLNEDEIIALHKYVNSISYENGTVYTSNSTKVLANIRNSSIKWISYNDEIKWLFDKIFHVAKQANDKFYKFDLTGAKDRMQYTSYDKHGMYGWHTDSGACGCSHRKLSCTLLLSDPDDFSGGEFEIFSN